MVLFSIVLLSSPRSQAIIRKAGNVSVLVISVISVARQFISVWYSQRRCRGVFRKFVFIRFAICTILIHKIEDWVINIGRTSKFVFRSISLFP